VDPRGGGCLLFLNSITGKIIAEKSKYRGVATPITPSLNPPLDAVLTIFAISVLTSGLTLQKSRMISQGTAWPW